MSASSSSSRFRGGAAALVDRYAGDERVAVVRPLAFLLAVAVNERDAAHALASSVLSMVERCGSMIRGRV